jgi:enoyl-CoA hydratase/carnithine racemase
MTDLVQRHDTGGVTTLTLNRPDKLNALTGAMFLELDAHLAAIEADTDRVGAVVLRGAGKCFSAGLDLAEAAGGTQTVTALFQARTIDRLSTLPQPLIAAVHGHCYTGALEVALAADILFASKSAKFGDTHAKWGLTPAWGMSQRLPRRVGRGHASRMMFTAIPVSAREALAIGLIDVCAPDERFDEDLSAFVAAIVANSWFSLRSNKRLMLDTDGLPLSAGLSHEFFRRPGRAPDFQQRVARFTSR